MLPSTSSIVYIFSTVCVIWFVTAFFTTKTPDLSLGFKTSDVAPTLFCFGVAFLPLTSLIFKLYLLSISSTPGFLSLAATHARNPTLGWSSSATSFWYNCSNSKLAFLILTASVLFCQSSALGIGAPSFVFCLTSLAYFFLNASVLAASNLSEFSIASSLKSISWGDSVILSTSTFNSSVFSSAASIALSKFTAASWASNSVGAIAITIPSGLTTANLPSACCITICLSSSDSIDNNLL